MSVLVRLCPSMSAYVRLCPPMSVYVRLCPSMSVYVLSFSDSMRQADIDGRVTPPPPPIKLAPNNIPKISKNRPTPFAKKAKIEAELKRMTKLDIIEPVEEPTDWVNSYVAVEKGDKIRICLDPSALNQYVQRERM